MEDLLTAINDVVWTYLMIGLLLGVALWFTIRTRGVQFTMIGEMLRLLVRSGQSHDDAREKAVKKSHKVSSFQAFAVSIASRVGTGNLAGVATAIATGGPGAVFWMWLTALLGAASAFVESTLAQLFKVRGGDSFRGGPAYYISRGLKKRWWAVLFAVLITVTFGLAFNSVQANAIAQSTATFGWNTSLIGCLLAVASLAVICGGIHSVSRFSAMIVPVMAIAYLVLALVVLAVNYDRIPPAFASIFEGAFGVRQIVGGGIGSAIMMGVRRGLFSNEAGEGSAPNVAATASVSHPVKQGLVQTLAVYTDTLLICTCTALMIIVSGVLGSGAEGIVLTQQALSSSLGESVGAPFVAMAIFFFGFSSIVANYYYGETNLRFITANRWVVPIYRLMVGAMVYVGTVSTLNVVWGLADITMAMMTLCNLVAILLLGRYAFRLLDDYRHQLRAGRDPQYHSSTIPELDTPVWD